MSVKDIASLQLITGAKAKQEFVRAHTNDEIFCRLLYYALNPMLTYNVSEDTLRNRIPGAWQPNDYKNIFEICDMLASRKGVDDYTLDTVCSFLRVRNLEEQELYIKLLSKTLRLGVTAKTINKIIPGLIPEWEVQQAYPIDKYPVAEGTEFWLTQKLNGVRATFYNGKLIARSGVPYKGLDALISEIERLPLGAYVLDGELTLKDKGSLSDNEAFRVATGILNSDDVNKTAICYTVFDIIPREDFDSDNPKIPYSERRKMLDIFSKFVSDDGTLRVLPVLYQGDDQLVIDKLLGQMVAEDKEGLMLNTDVPYKRTRHKGILKIKRFYTMDLKIIGYEEGTGRLEGTLGALVLEYKGNTVKVGSGFTDEQRTEFWANRNDIIGSLCEVKYKEISSDKNTGLESLQFPVFVQMRFDKSEVSFG
jgi:DNA ligase-1